MGSMLLPIFACDAFHFPLPDGHRFPLDKFRRLREQVLARGLVQPEAVHTPAAVTLDQMMLAHDPDYLERVLDGKLADAEIRRIGFPWSPALVERARRSAGGTLAAARVALQHGVGVNLAGGTHHASYAHGEGYCLFNDSIISARVLQAEGRIRRAVILDGDVHQGNGTAQIAANDPTIFTFSLHGERNFPLRKYPSDLDVGLPDGTEDEVFLSAWQRGVSTSLQRAQADLAIYLAGADPYRGDRLGRLAVTPAALQERDRMAVTMCRDAGLPVAVTMAGGYAKNIDETVAIQATTVAEVLRRA